MRVSGSQNSEATTSFASPLLVDFNGAATLLSVSARTVKRLVADGALPICRIGRRVLISVEALKTHVQAIQEPAHNQRRIESGTWKGKHPCHTDEKAHRTGGSSSPTQAANRLTDLLEQLTSKRPKPSICPRSPVLCLRKSRRAWPGRPSSRPSCAGAAARTQWSGLRVDFGAFARIFARFLEPENFRARPWLSRQSSRSA